MLIELVSYQHDLFIMEGVYYLSVYSRDIKILLILISVYIKQDGIIFLC